MPNLNLQTVFLAKEAECRGTETQLLNTLAKLGISIFRYNDQKDKIKLTLESREKALGVIKRKQELRAIGLNMIPVIKNNDIRSLIIKGYDHSIENQTEENIKRIIEEDNKIKIIELVKMSRVTSKTKVMKITTETNEMANQLRKMGVKLGLFHIPNSAIEKVKVANARQCYRFYAID